MPWFNIKYKKPEPDQLVVAKRETYPTMLILGKFKKEDFEEEDPIELWKDAYETVSSFERD